MDTLKPCPFCGCDMITTFIQADDPTANMCDGVDGYAVVECPECDAKITSWDNTQEGLNECIAKWNTRAYFNPREYAERQQNRLPLRCTECGQVHSYRIPKFKRGDVKTNTANRRVASGVQAKGSGT